MQIHHVGDRCFLFSCLLLRETLQCDLHNIREGLIEYALTDFLRAADNVSFYADFDNRCPEVNREFQFSLHPHGEYNF